MKANRDGKPGGSALAARLHSTAEKKEQIIQKSAEMERLGEKKQEWQGGTGQRKTVTHLGALDA